MTLANLESALHSFTHRVPFQKFLVELMSGQVFEVGHPEAMSVRGQIIVYVSPKRQYRFFDSASVCQLFDPI